MELNELIQRAQASLDGGDYGLAIAACTAALETYPTCLSAHRVLGEAYLEQGEIEHAVEHFERTLVFDPLNVVARLGLGVAAEERNDHHAAYTAYLRAWDLNPTLDQLRDELVRLRTTLGSEGRLHPTRAGLATTYARGGQLARAAAEWRAVLTAEPESDRANVALAEVLWRQRDDAGAAAACREALRLAPENARALAILADVEARRGEPSAQSTADRYRGVDPAGDVVAALTEARAPSDLGFLRQSLAVADFDFDAFAPPEPAAVPAEQAVALSPVAALAASHMAAPDLWDTVVRDLEPGESGLAEAGAGAVDDAIVPFDWADGGAGGGHGSLPSDLAADGAASPASSDSDTDTEFPAGFVPTDPAEAVSAGDDRPVWTDERATDEPGASEADLADLVLGDNFAAPTNGAADGRAADWPADVDADLPLPASTAASWADTPPASPNPFITADGRVDLTIGWDQLDQVLDEATPDTTSSEVGYTALLAELDAGGIAPFDAVVPSGDESAWEPFTAADLGEDPSPAPAVGPGTDALLGGDVRTEAEAVAPAVAAVDWAAPPALPAEADDPLAALTQNWDNIDQELLAAIPEEAASGYTDMLRNIDAEESLLPFDPGGADVVDPLANPDAIGDPLEFDDLLTVTSRDGTSTLTPTAAVDPVPETGDEPLAAGEPPPMAAASDPMPEPMPESWAAATATTASPVEAAPALSELLGELDGVEPFSFAVDGPPADGADGADFSDIEDVPFDPAAYAVPFAFDAPPMAVADNGAVPFAPGEIDEDLDLDLDLVVDLGLDLGLEVDPALTMGTVGGWTAAAGESGGDQGAGLGPAGSSVFDAGADADGEAAWPAFIGATSELIDRDRGIGGLFARLREEKGALVELGQLATDRRLSTAAPVVARATPNLVGVATNGANGLGFGRAVAVVDEASDLGLDAAGLRAQLRADPASAGEVAATIEGAIEGGTPSGLLRRALGEAYLKLGRGDAAAAQFRLAMARRGRR